MPQDLIHPRTRREFRDLCRDWGVLRTISAAFEVEGFEPCPGEPDNSDGMRRGRFDLYAKNMDWSNPTQVRRALRVFEEVLSWVSDTDHAVKVRAKLTRLLLQDGYVLNERGLIQPVATSRSDLPLDLLSDSTAVREHLDRLRTSGDDDPPLAISSAKALVEATAKHVLLEMGIGCDDQAKVPALVKAVQGALKLHPSDIAPTAKGRETIIRTLSNLSQVVVGLAELRNEYGPDHGRIRPSSGMQPRHAHLAVGAAETYCRFLLETLRDRQQGSH